MTTEIFIGLDKPNTALFKDLQAFISKNGGRLRLANQIEAEWAKSYHQVDRSNIPIKKARITFQYTKKEDEIIINNFQKMSLNEIWEFMPLRSYESIRKHIFLLRQKGLIGYRNGT